MLDRMLDKIKNRKTKKPDITFRLFAPPPDPYRDGLEPTRYGSGL